MSLFRRKKECRLSAIHEQDNLVFCLNQLIANQNKRIGVFSILLERTRKVEYPDKPTLFTVAPKSSKSAFRV
jgi:hypothetical protein